MQHGTCFCAVLLSLVFALEIGSQLRSVFQSRAILRYTLFELWKLLKVPYATSCLNGTPQTECLCSMLRAFAPIYLKRFIRTKSSLLVEVTLTSHTQRNKI